MDTTFYQDKLVLHDHLLTETYTKITRNADSIVLNNIKELLEKHKYSYIYNINWKTRHQQS